MSNRLKNETSPYLLQHAENPVDWYPWCSEAFCRAEKEDKPVFLSIGYSTCHWCHVMARESFENPEIAALLNRWFICIKVDREERPDIDSVYMSVCQAFTGSGGWPTSIFMTAQQKPFFAGTYFPPQSEGGMTGMRELLKLIHEKWETQRGSLLQQAEWSVMQLQHSHMPQSGSAHGRLLDEATALYRSSYDRKNGGFGSAPKFPSPHILLFLLGDFQRRGQTGSLQMAEHTLLQLYRGGLFDHIGGGFCRYSTDERFLVPHFEKMLYDNALLILAYSSAFSLTRNRLYLKIAEKTADYILREMTHPEGGFYSAQDADSGGREGAYYLLEPNEILRLLGNKDGDAFNRRFDITFSGHFEGKSIPNLLHTRELEDEACERLLPRVLKYRQKRHALHLDDKILSSWNGLTIAALCKLYRTGGGSRYLAAAERANEFLQRNLCRGDTLFASFREGKQGAEGFLDDYASLVFAQLALYEATLKKPYLLRAGQLCQKVFSDFSDSAGGFYLYGKKSEPLILRPKECYDGALPSGNSLMAFVLVRLSQLLPEKDYEKKAACQLEFLAAGAARYPAGYAMFLLALLEQLYPPVKVTIVQAAEKEPGEWLSAFPEGTLLCLQEPDGALPLQNGENTFYVCRGRSCLLPVNGLSACLKAAFPEHTEKSSG